MKLDRIIWGILLLFVGGVLLLDNFDVIDFHWWNVWSFFPIFIIILGINLLFGKNNSQAGSIITLVILVVALGFLFVKGQEKPHKKFWWKDRSIHFRSDMDDDDDVDIVDGKRTWLHFSEPLTVEANKKTTLTISGGAMSFEVKGATDSLFAANLQNTRGNFKLSKEITDSVTHLIFKMQDRKDGKWAVGEGNEADLYLNNKPIWDLNINLGAGDADFDLSNYKVRTLNFEGGVAKLDAKVGSLLPITDVNVKTGLTDVTIAIPNGSGCQIKSRTGLSSKDFEGFIKLDKNTYQTPNYKTATNKIFINFEGGLTSFKVEKY
ncbi:MAG: DUF5668 domain-containing protein [Pedobacter sp.]|nr:DUF5668 domain-containing protein [Pedobacter sp.]MDQ8053886.1 DUF5668 domain-containing protein [Pedobacter sp.]